MQVLCLIGEMDIERVRVGQRAYIRLEAFPGPVFNGVGVRTSTHGLTPARCARYPCLRVGH